MPEVAPRLEPSITIDDVRAAAERIAGHVNRTPVLTSHILDERVSARLFFKCENFQSAGAFKARGATNAVLQLSEEDAASGVVTHSSGNHAAALARAARIRGVPAHIVMPSNSAAAKIAATQRYGAEVILCEPTLEARESVAADVRADTGATLIHPFDDPRVMAGQGTVALELLSDVPDLDAVICPVGGGGLLSGTAVTVRALAPAALVMAAEPAEADDAARSLAAGRLIPVGSTTTIADGLRTSLSQRTFAHLVGDVDEVVTVTEDEIIGSMRLLWEVLKVVIEPSAAVSYAALEKEQERLAGLRIGVILTGGNLDLDRLPWAAG